ncbi:hypothetical protein J4418_00890 [Candidatus Woesearchaeota archaeon]|nr:hypothetical protein [Candidatus Woesearchaeota archaeon]
MTIHPLKKELSQEAWKKAEEIEILINAQLNPICRKIQHYKSRRENIEPDIYTKFYFCINWSYKTKYHSFIGRLDTKIHDLETKLDKTYQKLLDKHGPALSNSLACILGIFDNYPPAGLKNESYTIN